MNKGIVYIKENIVKIILWVLGLGAIGFLLIFSRNSFDLSDPSNFLFILASVPMLLLGLEVLIDNLTSWSNDKPLKKYYDELAVNPNSAKAYMEIARYYIVALHAPKQYDAEKGFRYINKAIELDPNLAEAYFLRALLYYTEGHHGTEALEDVEEALELEPNNEMALDLKDILDTLQP